MPAECRFAELCRIVQTLLAGSDHISLLSVGVYRHINVPDIIVHCGYELNARYSGNNVYHLLTVPCVVDEFAHPTAKLN